MYRNWGEHNKCWKINEQATKTLGIELKTRRHYEQRVHIIQCLDKVDTQKGTTTSIYVGLNGLDFNTIEVQYAAHAFVYDFYHKNSSLVLVCIKFSPAYNSWFFHSLTEHSLIRSSFNMDKTRIRIRKTFSAIVSEQDSQTRNLLRW